jgi:carboxylesterase
MRTELFHRQHRQPVAVASAPASRSGRVLLLHGLASTAREFALVMHPLRRLGVTPVALEVDGYTHGSLVAAIRWEGWVEAAVARVEAEIAASPGPFVLGGLCTGALLAVAAATRKPLPGLRGLALLSPLVSYDGWALPWWYRMRPLAYALRMEDHFAMHERPPYGLKNERMRQMVRTQMETQQATLCGPSRVSLRVIRESERLSRHAVPTLARLGVPALVLHARDDEICRLASVQRAFGAIPPDMLRTVILENSYHMITADNDRQAVAMELARFAHGLCGSSHPDAEVFVPSGPPHPRTRR